MKERPILFNGEMVRAILDDKKTQTRRPIKHKIKGMPQLKSSDVLEWDDDGDSGDDEYRGCAIWYCDDMGGTPEEIVPKYLPGDFIKLPEYGLTLEVTAVRVERLQDISEADAEAEGVFADLPDSMTPPMNAYDAFFMLWSFIYGDASWDANPWVWVYEFKISERKASK